MPTPITETTVSFTYNIADTLWASTDADGRTGSASYTGPDRIWVFVHEDTGKFSRIQPPLTTLEDGADVPTPIEHRKVEVVAQDDPVVMAIIMEDLVTYDDDSKITENLPDGSTCEYEAVARLSQTYNKDELVHDGTSWTLPAFKEAPVTWDDVLNGRNGALTASDGKISPDMPADLKQIWVDYRQALRDLPVTFGKGTENEVDAWKVNMPDHPEEI
jgi:hypothetical protein